MNTFITGLEREDIEALSTALYKIPKATEKFAEHFIAGSQCARGVDFSRQVALLEQATDAVQARNCPVRQMDGGGVVGEQNARLVW